MQVVVVAPGYLCLEYLPYVSDLLYHGKIIYFLPTGISPLEHHAVLGFPQYCRQNNVALPAIIWEMCGTYFENTHNAALAANVIRPLQPKHVLIAGAIYDRDVVAIERTKKHLQDDGLLREIFNQTQFSLEFPSREFISHLFLDLFIERGYRGVIDYLRQEADTPDKFLETLAAVLINRFRLFSGRESSLLIYDHSWYPLLMRALEALSDRDSDRKSPSTPDFDHVEQFCFKLFETILLPLFGRIDAFPKAEMVATLLDERSGEAQVLKEECRNIAREVVLLATSEVALKDQLLRERINDRIIEPLAALIRKPRNDALNAVRNFVLDSTVIGGLLSLIQTPSIPNLAMAVAAGGLSAGTRYLLDESRQRKTEPSSLVIDGMRNSSLQIEAMQGYLSSISVHDLEIPAEWQGIIQGKRGLGSAL